MATTTRTVLLNVAPPLPSGSSTWSPSSVRVLLGGKCRLRASSRDVHVRARDKPLQVVLWGLTGAYVSWLFVLPFAPGDPVWAIKPETVSMLLDLSLNFFLVLPLANIAGFHPLQAPVIHPTAEALFNIAIGWTVLFGPLLFTDKRRSRFKWSLEALWLGQLFLTNTFLLPYMAIRLNPQPKSVSSTSEVPPVLSNVSSAMVSGSRLVAVVGGIVGAASLLWGLFGRPECGFGDIPQRWSYFINYVSTDRVAYAFLWDLVLYSVFQPWLVNANLDKVNGMRGPVKVLSFVPYVGLAAYLWCLSDSTGKEEGHKEGPAS